MKNTFVLLFTTFSIVSIGMPVGIQLQLESMYAVAETEFPPEYKEIKNNGKAEMPSSDSESKFMILEDPFGFTMGSNNKETNEKIMTSNIVELDQSSTGTDTTSQLGFKSSRENINNSNANTNVNNANEIILDNQLSTKLTSTTTMNSEVSAQSSNKVYGDFNGDGFDDLAIGASNEDLPSASGNLFAAGGVNVLYGSSNGLSATSPRPDQFWTQDTTDVNDVAEEGDAFGHSLTSGDFNGDGRDDLAIGVLGEDVTTAAGTVIDAGAVNVLYGSSNGLSATSPRPDQFWTQDTTDVNDVVETGDIFGNTLVAADFNGDGRDDLAIGTEGEDVTTGAGTMTNAGAVNVLYGSSNGLSATSPRPDQFWTQSTADVNDVAENNDHFGRGLSSGDFNGDGRDDLAIGVFGEVIGVAGGTNMGAVNVLYGSSNGLSATSPRPDQFWTQDTTDVNDVAEDGDLFGSTLASADFNADGFDDLAIGASQEDVDTGTGTVPIAGAVNVLYSSSNGLSATTPRPDQFWTQNTADVNDFAESFEEFGFSLSAADFNADGFDDLAIGVPFEDVDTGTGTINDAGAVNVLYSSSNGLSATTPRPDQFLTQNTADIDDLAEEDDKFGFSLEASDFNRDGRNDLAIGVVGENVITGAGNMNDAGAVNVLYSSSNGLSATTPRPDQFWTQSTADVNDVAEGNDDFGASVG